MAKIMNSKYSSIQNKEDEQNKDINDLLLDDQNLVNRVQPGMSKNNLIQENLTLMEYEIN